MSRTLSAVLVSSMTELRAHRRTMGNSTHTSFFSLTAYSHSGHLRYVYFLLVLLLYLLIVFSNVLLLVLICVSRSLHEPMYMFLCSLFVTELYGSTGLFLLLMVQILSDVHTVSTSVCFLQIFNLYSYGGVEFWMLSVMSYDRYLAVCFPLQYNTRMSSGRVLALIAVSWLVPLVFVLVKTSLLLPLDLCGNNIHKVYCDYFSVVRLSCSDTTLNNIYELASGFVAMSCNVSLILFTYCRILQVCFSGSTQTRRRAMLTCTPHLASLFNFSFGFFFETAQSRYSVSHVPGMFRIFMSLYFLTCQPLFNPVMFGLRLSKIRLRCKDLLCA